VNDPAAVGVPVIAPVDAFKASPFGNEPLATEYVYGRVPPEAVTWLENAAPTSPEFVAEQFIDGPAMIVYGQVEVATTPKASFT
jgi:hypothetical protein